MPVSKDNNEKETVPEVSNLEMLINDSERGENEVIENEVMDEMPINEEVSIDVGSEVPKIMNERAEEEIVIEKEHLKGKNETIEDEAQDKMSYSRNRENLLDKVNNRKVEDIEVKEIEIEIGYEQEEGLENKKVEYEGLEMEGINKKRT